MELMLPSEKFKDSFIAAVREYQADDIGAKRFKRYRDLSLESLEHNFSAFLLARERMAAC